MLLFRSWEMRDIISDYTIEPTYQKKSQEQYSEVIDNVYMSKIRKSPKYWRRQMLQSYLWNTYIFTRGSS